MTLYPPKAEVRRLELHEARAHAMREGRHVRELPDGILLHDDVDPDPFWNRIASVRLPSDQQEFARRLDALIVQFATLNRRAHVWASPGYQEPEDLERRLARAGFVDLGRGLLMALTDRGPVERLVAAPSDLGLTVERLAGDLGPERDVRAAEIALVAGEAFAVEPSARRTIVDDVVGLFERPGFAAYLVRVDGEPAGVAKATTFDGATYLSTIGTRPAYRGRGVAQVATAAAAIDGIEARSEWIYLGVFEQNVVARRLYERLGFENVGDHAGDWLL
jgi:ribosomal protein S18 acetylase RimI-like enzyme